MMKKLAVELAITLTIVILAIIQIERIDQWAK
jgi:hypothetical protein